MVADDLAIELSERYIGPDQIVLDPFCGTGRLLAASSHMPGKRIGFDVNPLSCLVSRAKLSKFDAALLSAVVADGKRAQAIRGRVSPIDDVAGRRVAWFSEPIKVELAQIVSWVNSLQLSQSELLVVGACLSATARDVSFARKSGWKLHRLPEENRTMPEGAAWRAFLRRLNYCAVSTNGEPVVAAAAIEQLDSSALSAPTRWSGLVDVVLTSPPYGDSRTTVQYGSASEICLHVVSLVQGLESYRTLPGAIDRLCLGGTSGPEDERLLRFWSGRASSTEGKATARFLSSLSAACGTIADVVRPEGAAVFVVGRRSTGGFRLRMDDFLADEMETRGFVLDRTKRRALKEKFAPRYVNRFGRAKSEELRASGRVPTMRDEIILSFTKKRADNA